MVDTTQDRAPSKDAGDILKDRTHPDAKVHQFDDDMSPEEKKNQAQKAGPTASSSRGVEGANEIPLNTKGNITSEKKDIGGSNPDLQAKKNEEKDILKKEQNDASDTKPSAPATTKQSSSPLGSRVFPGGFSVNNDTRCGWTDFSTLPNPGQDHLMAALKKASLTDEEIATIYSRSRIDDYTPDDSLLGQLLSDAYYGKWFQNGGALLLAVVMTFALTRMGAGLFACLTLGAFLGKSVWLSGFENMGGETIKCLVCILTPFFHSFPTFCLLCSDLLSNFYTTATTEHTR